MKGGIIGYSAILIILISGAAAIFFITQAGPVEDTVSTTEGLLASSENFDFFVIKAFDQSIEFISQRAAYELANNGGLYRESDNSWNIYYPSISVLERNLEERIVDGLPFFYKKINRAVNLDSAIIIVNPQNPLTNSREFYVIGNANISIFDDVVRSRTFLNHEINSVAKSNYFKLINAGREIIENETFNSSLGDVTTLETMLNNEARFSDLSFDLEAINDIVYVNITEKCYPSYTYCLAPLNPGESKTNGFPKPNIPYDYLKLKFNIKAKQTTPPSPTCKFSVKAIPPAGSVGAGNELDLVVDVKNLGSDDAIIDLTAEVFNKSTMTKETTISLNFDKDLQKISDYPAILNITTSSLTLGGEYLVNVSGKGCAPSMESFSTFDLIVNPSMTFSINVNPDTVRLIQEANYFNTTNVIVSFIGGLQKDVHLDLHNAPAGISWNFDKNDMQPNFISVLNLTTDGSTPSGTHTLKIIGIGGGSYVEKEFDLRVEPPFDFSIATQPASDFAYQSTHIFPSLIIKNTTTGTPEDVSLNSVTIVNSLGLPRADDYLINLQFNSLVCNPKPNLEVDCNIVFDISTQKTTPVDVYSIDIQWSSSKQSHTTTFFLNVKLSECFDMGSIPSLDCIAKNGPIVTACKYWQCINYVCQKSNYPPNSVDPSGLCGIENCNDKCEPFGGVDSEYRNPSSLTYKRVCDGLGNCNNTFDLGKCNYGTIRPCRWTCIAGKDCQSGYYCEPAVAKCRVCMTGNCGDQKAIFTGGCKDVLPNAGALKRVTCNCFGVDTSDAVVWDSVAGCGSCDKTPDNLEDACASYNFGCEGLGVDNGCSISQCTLNNACRYPITCDDGICEGENGENGSICPADCPSCPSFTTEKDCSMHNCYWNSGTGFCS